MCIKTLLRAVGLWISMFLEVRLPVDVINRPLGPARYSRPRKITGGP